MPVPLVCPVTLAPEEHARLESLVRAHSTPQALAFRCRLILWIAAPDRPSNLHVATEMACERHTVGRWRQRYLAHGFNGLQDAPRSGRRQRVSPLCVRGCAIDLQKMNWKFKAGFHEHTGVSLTVHVPNNPRGGHTRVHQDTAQSRHRQRSAPPSATCLSAR